MGQHPILHSPELNPGGDVLGQTTGLAGEQASSDGDSLHSPATGCGPALDRIAPEIEQALACDEAILNTIRNPFLVLRGDLRVERANQAFYNSFNVSPAEVEGRVVFELNDGAWNKPELHGLLEDILPRNGFWTDVEVTVESPQVPCRTLLLNARRLERENAEPLILVSIEDTTQRLARCAVMERSEIRYRRLFETAQDGILILEPVTRKITDANPFVAQLLGYSREELLGKELWQIGLLKDEPASQAAFRELQERGFIRYEDLPLETRGGTKREVEFVSNLYNENGHTVIQCNIRDITERKQAEEKLRRSRMELTDFIENASVAMHWVGPDGIILWANRTELEMLGYTREEYVGHHISEFHADRPVIEDILWRLTNHETLHNYEARLRCEDGSIRQVLISSNVLWEDNKFIHTRCFTQDITERKRAEEALRANEERYRTLFNSIDEGFCVIELLFDPDGRPVDYRFLEVNPSFEKQSGLRGAAGKRVLELIPNQEEHWADVFGRVALTGEPVRLVNETKALKSWFDVYAFRLGGPESRKVAILFTNITERKQTEEALRESEERFRSMADNIPSLAWMADATGGIFWYNKRWFDYTGKTFAESEGRGWTKVIHFEHVERAAARVQHSLDTGELWEDTFPLRGKDGTYRWFLSRAFPIRSSEGKISRWFGTNTDIQELRETQEALQKTQEQLEEHAANLEKTVAERTASLRETVGELEAFSHSIAHDMRAPLRSMSGYSQIVLGEYAGKLDAKGVDYLERIVRSSHRLDELIRDTLNYSKVLGGVVQNEPVNLDRLLRDIVETYPDCQPPVAEIQIEGTLPSVLGNEAFLTRCISSLLSNAVKFVAPEKSPCVRIWAEPHDSQVRLCFRDNGVGIAAENRVRIFRMFERLHPAREYEGTGIGLTIARKAAQRMGGEIGFESEPGQGSTFWIQLQSA